MSELIVLGLCIWIVVKLVKKNVSNEEVADEIAMEAFAAFTRLTHGYKNKDLNAKLNRLTENAVCKMWMITPHSPTAVYLMSKYTNRVDNNNPISVKAMKQSLSKLEGANYKFKKEFLFGLLSLVYVDGDINQKEARVLNAVLSALKLNENDYNNIYGQFKELQETEQKKDNINTSETSKTSVDTQNYKSYAVSEFKTPMRRRRVVYSPRTVEAIHQAYKIMELPKDATITEIENQYNRLVSRYNSDATLGGSVKMEAETKIENVEKAFEYIRKVRRF